MNWRDAIIQFSGLRPNRVPEGLHVDTYEDLKGYINLSGVRSTGLTLSAAMGKYVAHLMVSLGMNAPFKKNFIGTRKGFTRFADHSVEQKAALIEEQPLYGNIVCRCETVTEQEILEAIHRPLGARSVDAVKRRVRPGTGRCQAGFCTPKVIEILARELNVPASEIMKNEKGSYYVVGTCVRRFAYARIM